MHRISCMGCAKKYAFRLRLSAFLLAMLLFITIGVSGCLAAEDTPTIRFACMSDLHLDDVLIYSSHSNTSQFETALQTAVAKGYDDLFICGGDMSSYGRTGVWDTIKETACNAGFNQILFALGNHEYGTLIENQDGDEDFMAFTGKNSIYYDEIVAGYHFIFLGCEDSDVSGKYFSDSQALWFGSTLDAAVNDTPDKPVFVISHYPLSYSKVGDRITKYLEKYENVFFFWGHEHSTEWEDYDITDYTTLQSGYVSSRMGSVQYGIANIADALLVDVYDNRVELTMERTDGAALKNKTTTVYLSRSCADCTIERIAVYNGNTELTLKYPLPHESMRLYLAYYDNKGRPCGSELFSILASDEKITFPLEGIPETCHSMRTFFFDSTFRPVLNAPAPLW